MAKLGNPQETIQVLQKHDFHFQKKFGQNFLIDTTVLDRIISSAEITKEDCVLEIGPGIGTMTQYLAERAGSVVAVEIDKALIPILILFTEKPEKFWTGCFPTVLLYRRKRPASIYMPLP